jgi:hypothetical protein
MAAKARISPLVADGKIASNRTSIDWARKTKPRHVAKNRRPRFALHFSGKTKLPRGMRRKCGRPASQ